MTTERLPIDVRHLPKTWELTDLAAIGAEVKPGFASGRHSRDASGQIPHLRPMNVDVKGRVDLKDVKYVIAGAGAARLARGDVLFNNTNSPELVGKTAYFSLNGDFAYSNHMTRIRVPAPISPKYIAFQLQLLQLCGFFRYLCVKHVNQASVSSSTLSTNVPVALAPVAEQDRIVASIEQQFSRLDGAEAAIGRSVRRTEQLRAAIMRLVDVGPYVPLGDLLTEPLANGRSVPTATDGGGFPVLRLTALRSGGRVDLAQRKMGAWTSADAGRFFVRPGDFLIARGNGSLALVGRGGLVEETSDNVAYPDTMIRARIDGERMHREFLRLAWDGQVVRRQIEDVARTTAGIHKVNQQDLERIRVPAPCPEEQMRVVTEIERCLTVLTSLSAAVQRAQIRSRRLRRSILEQAFSGRLAAQDPRDEPALTLLRPKTRAR